MHLTGVAGQKDAPLAISVGEDTLNDPFADMEQACLAYRLSNRGLIRAVSFLAPLPDLGAMITECFDDQAMHQRVRLWSSQIDSRDDPASRIALDLLQ